MKFELNAEKAKTQAKNLSAYLATINRKISLGNAYEAVAHLYGAKSWNVLSSQLDAAVAEVAEPQLEVAVEKKYFYVENGKRVEALATATMVSDDHRRDVTFSVAAWLMTAKEEAILDLAEIDWYGDYPADAVSDASRDPAVVEVYRYLEVANEAKSMFEDDIGFCTTVNDAEALRFLRAFRYPVFLKVALKAAKCNAELYAIYTKHLDEQSTQYFVENWEELEHAWAEEPSVLDWDDSAMSAARGVTPCSGVVDGGVEQSVAPARTLRGAQATMQLNEQDSERTYRLPYGIEIYCSVGEGGSLDSKLSQEFTCDGDEEEAAAAAAAAVNAMESLLLAMACAGVDLSTPEVAVAIKGAVEKVANEI